MVLGTNRCNAPRQQWIGVPGDDADKDRGERHNGLQPTACGLRATTQVSRLKSQEGFKPETCDLRPTIGSAFQRILTPVSLVPAPKASPPPSQ
ncbi:hypothetical protein LuPra_05026 [Luteitalea pratensis]|uniref:Uncharacterized protein n=1 Tax=Luteitalea pratensis TaxID=1855912 RepID=A0A143PVA8_LUTPR|nr:hypothetical protein LuPra_05026 [Luteitalea pratensis]